LARGRLLGFRELSTLSYLHGVAGGTSQVLWKNACSGMSAAFGILDLRKARQGQ
jgi:hypothetical protein